MLKKIILPSDLSIMLIWIILVSIFVLIPELSGTIIRTLLVVSMILFIPGYVIIAALFPKRDNLKVLERIALSFGLSIAVVSLLGLLLKYLFKMELIPVLLVICSDTIVLTIIAMYRRGKLPEKERYDMLLQHFYELLNEEFNRPRRKTDWIKNCILIFLIVSGISILYFVITTPKVGEQFTEFYILGPDGKAGNYPAKLKYNYPATILVGVVNHEYISANYTVQIALDKNILTDSSFSLGHNETFEKNMTFIPDKDGTNMKLEFLLFREDNFTAPYRELYLWVSVVK